MEIGVKSDDATTVIPGEFENRKVRRGRLRYVRQVNGIDALLSQEGRGATRQAFVEEELHRQSIGEVVDAVID